jgi:hypothetical protein
VDRKGQYESSCRVVEDLTSTASRHKREADEALREVKSCKEALGRQQELHRDLERKVVRLKDVCRARDAEVARYEVK